MTEFLSAKLTKHHGIFTAARVGRGEADADWTTEHEGVLSYYER